MKHLIIVLLILLTTNVFSQTSDSTQKSDSSPKLNADTSIAGLGVAVSPSHLNFNLKPGQSKTQSVKITNDTKKPYKFKISFQDFNVEGKDRVNGIKAGEGTNSLSKWTTATPSFVEVAPGQSAKIAITVKIPDDESANKAAWCIMMVDQAEERKSLSFAGDPNDKKMAFGVIPVFAFGVYIYQNPPNVAVNKVEIQGFKLNTVKDKDGKTKRTIEIEAKNIGDGIAFSTAYVELTNTSTGKQQRLMVKQFTIYPGGIRNFSYDLPAGLEKGNYTAVGVLDFGSKEEIQAAEMEFKIE